MSDEEIQKLKADIKAEIYKRISLLTETLARKDKDIETLKAEIVRQNNIIVDYMNTNASLRDLAAEEKKVIKAMAKWMKNNTILESLIKNICKNQKVCISQNQTGTCEQCIINYFESEVKE